MNGFDAGSGRLIFNVRYHAEGSRTVTTVGPDGKGSRQNVNRKGSRSPEQPVTFSPAEQQAFEYLSKEASRIPPQRVGQESALGGQTNYYDPANNRLTKQVVANPDGSRTVNSFDDNNQVG
jgi:hypothetical protein